MGCHLEVNEKILQQMVQKIVQVCDPEQVILFGSRAGDSYQTDSDIDLLIIEKKPFNATRSRLKEIIQIERALDRLKVPTDILVYSTEEIERWRFSINHIVSHALRDGKVLYERS